MKNTLFTGDNLYILHGMNSESVDLIYLDPPFNTKRIFSAPVGSKAAGTSFKDMWTWEDVDEECLITLEKKCFSAVEYIKSVGLVNGKAMKAYLTYMLQRIIELHRILKPNGSFYLHCDPTASHYLKNLLDAIFGKENFRNEITWERSHQHNLASKRFDVVTDIILFYSKSEDYYFISQYSEVTSKKIKMKFPYLEEETGRYFMHRNLEQTANKGSTGLRIIQGKRVISTMGWRWAQETFDERLEENPYLIYWTKNGKPRYKIYKDEYEGRLATNLWTEFKGLSSNSKERTGYPTQKPLALMHRIINASCPVNGIVLDPFCGCATTCIAAQQLGRSWIGIDIEPSAPKILIERLSDDAGLFKDFIHLETLPKRTDIVEVIPDISIKERLFKEQNGHCNGCGLEFNIYNLEIDHIIPKAKGGGDYIENFQLLCSSCNKMKGTRPMEYLRMKIKQREELMKDELSFGE